MRQVGQTTIYYLELTDPKQFKEIAEGNPNLDFRQAKALCPALNRFFYTEVGKPWDWIDRLAWSDEQWMQYLARPELETWLFYHAETPIGYVELELQADEQVQLVYLGLLPHFTGKGYGKYFLSRAVQRAWALGAKRVWLHTCSKDHPYALPNYQARGFCLYKQVTQGSHTKPNGPFEQFANFSTDVYQHAELAQACLWLQDHKNLNVNVLLYCCWLGFQGIALSQAELQQISIDIAVWETTYVQSLRTQRKKLKQWKGPEKAAVLQHRQKLKELELDAERVEQQMIVANHKLFNSSEKAQENHPEQQIYQNLDNYLQTTEIEANEQVQQAIAALMNACLQVSPNPAIKPYI